MSDIPDSYEDLEEIIKNRKKKRRSSLVKTLLITVISIIALFVIWLLYPVSAPEYAMRDLLPEQTAVSAELHHPRDLLQHLQKTDYLRHTAELPIWSSFQREYAVEFRDKVLQNDIEEFIQETHRDRRQPDRYPQYTGSSWRHFLPPARQDSGLFRYCMAG